METYIATAQCINCNFYDTYTVNKGTELKKIKCVNCLCSGYLMYFLKVE